MKIKLAILIAASALLYFVFFSPVGLWQGHAPKEDEVAKYQMALIATSIQWFYMEYGEFPNVSASGDITSAAENAALMRVLSGEDKTVNPKGIPFLEVGRAGSESLLDPESGAFPDPWGNFYRIRFARNGMGPIRSPYEDEGKVNAAVIVWSVGKDGVQGSEQHPDRFSASDDHVSWQ